MLAIPNMEKPKGCWDCFNADCNHWGEHGYENTADCPLIEIDESEMEYLYKEFGLEKDENLTDRAKELKRAILMGYLYAKKDIVRCGECKWCDDKGKGRALICTNPYIDMDIHPLDFCSYGERRAE